MELAQRTTETPSPQSENPKSEIRAKIEKVKSKNQKNQNFCFQLSAFNFASLHAPCSLAPCSTLFALTASLLAVFKFAIRNPKFAIVLAPSSVLPAQTYLDSDLC
jgi:hypothetical protein